MYVYSKPLWLYPSHLTRCSSYTSFVKFMRYLEAKSAGFCCYWTLEMFYAFQFIHIELLYDSGILDSKRIGSFCFPSLMYVYWTFFHELKCRTFHLVLWDVSLMLAHLRTLMLYLDWVKKPRLLVCFDQWNHLNTMPITTLLGHDGG